MKAIVCGDCGSESGIKYRDLPDSDGDIAAT